MGKYNLGTLILFDCDVSLRQIPESYEITQYSIPLTILVVPQLVSHVTADRDPAIEIPKIKMEDAGIGVEVEIKSEKAKEVVENVLVKVEEVEAKSALIKDEVGVESGVINVAEARARNEKDEVKVMKENEAEAEIEVKFKPKSINDNLALI